MPAARTSHPLVRRAATVMDVPAGGLLEERIERAWYGDSPGGRPPRTPSAPGQPHPGPPSVESDVLETSSEVAESIGSHVRRAPLAPARIVPPNLAAAHHLSLTKDLTTFWRDAWLRAFESLMSAPRHKSLGTIYWRCCRDCFPATLDIGARKHGRIGLNIPRIMFPFGKGGGLLVPRLSARTDPPPLPPWLSQSRQTLTRH